MNKSIDYLKSLLNKNDVIVVGVSGGPDSMCLLHLLNDLKDVYNLKIIVAHMNHKVRKQADIEEKYVRNFAKNNDLIFELYELKEKISSNFHCETRIIRYNFFEDLVKKYKANYVMTAHHSDDLMETILMRIGRGSNLKGYSGFEILSNKDNYKIVKPLIFYTKDEIVKFMDDNNYKYYIDNTNNEDDFLRNRYRHNVLPKLKQENKNIHEKYLKYSKVLLDADNFISNYVTSIINKIYIDNKLNISLFLNEDIYIQKRIIEYLLSTIYIDDLYKVDDNTVEEIIKIIYSKKPNASILLPNDIKIIKEYDKLYIDNDKSINKVINKDLYYEDINIIIKEVNTSSDKSNNTIRLDTNELSLPLYFRYRHDGDKIFIKNNNGYTKLKDIFIDLKIPKNKRNEIPILCDNNDEIIWIPMLKKSKFDKEIDEKYNLIISCEKK